MPTYELLETSKCEQMRKTYGKIKRLNQNRVKIGRSPSPYNSYYHYSNFKRDRRDWKVSETTSKEGERTAKVCIKKVRQTRRKILITSDSYELTGNSPFLEKLKPIKHNWTKPLRIEWFNVHFRNTPILSFRSHSLLSSVLPQSCH